MRRCVCPGSFDPMTKGHLDVIARALGLFDEVVVALLHNPAKQGSFAVAERLAMAEEAVAEAGLADRVSIAAYGGRLLVDVCRELDAPVIVKGVRGAADVAYELPMAVMNRDLAGVETVFLIGDPALSHVSSSLVREIAAYGGDVAAYVPAGVQRRLRARGPEPSGDPTRGS